MIGSQSAKVSWWSAFMHCWKSAIAQIDRKARLGKLPIAPARLGRRLKNQVWNTKEVRLYTWDAQFVPVESTPGIMHRDCLQDLAFYEPVEPWHPRRQEFVWEAMRRIGRDEHIYTHLLDGRLVHYGWLIERQEQTELTDVGHTYSLPPHSAALYDYYTHPLYRGRGFYTKSLRQMLADAACIPGTRLIFIGVLADNVPSRRAIEKAGFKYRLSFFEKRRFGRTIRWSCDPEVFQSLRR